VNKITAMTREAELLNVTDTVVNMDSVEVSEQSELEEN
jgi:hypothetical protein